METIFWVLGAIIVLAIVYVCVSFRKRKEAIAGKPSTSEVAPGKKEHGVDLQARRKSFDDLT